MNKINTKTKKSKKISVFKALGLICLMILCGTISYLGSTHEIKAGYDKIAIVTISKEGLGIEELSKSFLPDLNIKLATRMIKSANGFVSDNITFLKGQRVKIPSKDATKSWITDRVIMMNQ